MGLWEGSRRGSGGAIGGRHPRCASATGSVAGAHGTQRLQIREAVPSVISR
jgi:hypothetical protein